VLNRAVGTDLFLVEQVVVVTMQVPGGAAVHAT
jgi:hypothetical protein